MLSSLNTQIYFKIVLLGEGMFLLSPFNYVYVFWIGEVGKSSLVTRYVKDEFNDQQ